MALKGLAKRTIQEGADNLTNFRVGNVRGELFQKGHYPSTGRMPALYADMLQFHASRNPVYVVYSYATPIAWVNVHVTPKDSNNPNSVETRTIIPIDPSYAETNQWVIPDVNYSVTTTNHQNVTTLAITIPHFYDGVKW